MRQAIIERVARMIQRQSDRYKEYPNGDIDLEKLKIADILYVAGFFELLDILMAVEWKGVSSWGMEEEGCPICHSERIDGHKRTCALKAAIAKAKGA